MNIGKYVQWTHCTKMGADSSAENTPNAPKILDFYKKRASLSVCSPRTNGMFMNTFYRKLIQGDCTKNAALKCIILHK